MAFRGQTSGDGHYVNPASANSPLELPIDPRSKPLRGMWQSIGGCLLGRENAKGTRRSTP